MADDVPQDAAASGFPQRVQRALAPLVEPSLNEHTRQSQRNLLLVAFVLFLLTSGVVSFKEVTPPGLRVDVTATHDFVTLITMAVCVYLEAVAFTRCYGDLTLHRIRTHAAELEFETLEHELRFFEPRTSAETMTELLRAHVTHDVSVAELGQPPPGVSDEFRRDVRQIEVNEAKKLHEFRRHSRWMRRSIKSTSRVKRLNLVVEIMFPLAFGAAAIVTAIRQLW